MKSYKKFITKEVQAESDLLLKRHELKQVAFESHMCGLIGCGDFGQGYSDFAISQLTLAQIQQEIERLKALAA